MRVDPAPPQVLSAQHDALASLREERRQIGAIHPFDAAQLGPGRPVPHVAPGLVIRHADHAGRDLQRLSAPERAVVRRGVVTRFVASPHSRSVAV